MIRRMILPTVKYTAEATAIALAAVWGVSLAMHSMPVDIATGCTVAWLALTFLPCPCHKRGGRR